MPQVVTCSIAEFAVLWIFLFSHWIIIFFSGLPWVGQRISEWYMWPSRLCRRACVLFEGLTDYTLHRLAYTKDFQAICVTDGQKSSSDACEMHVRISFSQTSLYIFVNIFVYTMDIVVE